ncbi:hypothetical protein P9112_010062 [Eukaryota sp. TZLM1-RC]
MTSIYTKFTSLDSEPQIGEVWYIVPMHWYWVFSIHSKYLYPDQKPDDELKIPTSDLTTLGTIKLPQHPKITSKTLKPGLTLDHDVLCVNETQWDLISVYFGSDGPIRREVVPKAPDSLEVMVDLYPLRLRLRQVGYLQDETLAASSTSSLGSLREQIASKNTVDKDKVRLSLSHPEFKALSSEEDEHSLTDLGIQDGSQLNVTIIKPQAIDQKSLYGTSKSLVSEQFPSLSTQSHHYNLRHHEKLGPLSRSSAHCSIPPSRGRNRVNAVSYSPETQTNNDGREEDFQSKVSRLERALRSTKQQLEEEKAKTAEFEILCTENKLLKDELQHLKASFDSCLQELINSQNQILNLKQQLEEKTQENDQLRISSAELTNTSTANNPENTLPQCPVIESSNLAINYNQKLGQGGFATVYAARWFSLEVAVKIVDIVNEGKAKLKKEIGFLTKLNYPCVLRVFGITYINNQIGIVMEKADGKLQIPSSLSQNSLTIAKNICCTLKFLQSRCIIHGDIKPDNVLIVNGQIRLADFGTSRVIASNSTLPSANAYTAKYAALEVLNEEPVKASDIYSIGVLLYELLTNEVAFKGFNQFTLLGAKYQGKSLKFSENVPPVLVNLINRCMSNEISERPNIDQILEILENL